MTSHLAALPGGEWSLWRWIGLRSAGFSTAGPLTFASPVAAAAADALGAAEDAAAALRRTALDGLRRERARGGDPAALRRIERALQQGRVDALPGGLAPEVAEVLGAFRTAEAHRAARARELDQAHDVATADTIARARDVAATPRFREALAWQNHRALATLDGLLHGDRHDADTRRKALVVAEYLQRYCLKNDSIGFFGPVGWASVRDTGPAIDVRPGAGLLATSTVYLEHWGVAALARRIGAEPALRPWLAPRLHTALSVDGDVLRGPEGDRRLTAHEAAVLARCTGDVVARELAAALAKAAAGPSEAEVFAILDDLAATGTISWTLEVPLEPNPERELRRRLERIGDPERRDAALAALGDLEAGREALVAAAGDAAGVVAAQQGLEATFSGLTGEAGTRRAGDPFAGRTLAYLDCRRDVEVDLGPDLLGRLGPPLSLILSTSRRYTHEAAAAFRGRFRQLHDRLAGGARDRAVDMGAFFGAMRASEEVGRVTVDELTVVQERWRELLALPMGARCVTRSVEELRPRVEAAFGAPAPGWNHSRYLNPDVLIAAADVDAIRRGDFLFVLGEVHELNTLMSASFAMQHPDPAELWCAVERDFPYPVVVALQPEDAAVRVIPHLGPTTVRAQFHDGPRPTSTPPACWLRLGDLVVDEVSGGLVVRTRDRAWSFDAVDFFGIMLLDTSTHPSLLPPAPHTPRVVFDQLVVCRERWCVPLEALERSLRGTPRDRFREVRRWARQLGLPRFVFVKLKGEHAPIFLDLDSVGYVELFCKMLRREAASAPAGTGVSITEMLPGLDECWLVDRDGNRYVSELRMVALDPRRPTPMPYV